MEKDIIKKLNEYKNTLEDIGSKLNIFEKENRLRELDAIINRPDFWTNVKNTKDILNEYKSLRKIIDEYSSIKENIDTLIEMVSIDIDYVDSELDKLNSDIENLKISTMLMVSLIPLIAIWKYTLVQVVRKVMIGLTCYIGCILDTLKRMVILMKK